MIKKVLLALLLPLSLTAVTAYSQPKDPLHWQIEAKSEGDGVYSILAKGTFSGRNWHIYDLEQRDGGPNATTFEVSGEGIQILGGAEVLSPVDYSFDEVFGMEIGTLKGEITLSRKVRGSGSVTATLEWQACNERTHECLTPSEFETTLSLGESAETTLSPSTPETETTGAGSLEQGNVGKRESGKSLWSKILAAIAWGFVALLTPCVFPMVPMTVSFFLKQKSGKRLALFFGLSIVVLYTLPVAILILISLLTGGTAGTADVFNFLATHWLPNLIFFVVFMVFAASFFGAFEINLPSKLVNGSDKNSERGGMIGAFFVALTLVLVSFSCTGPIVGSVLIESAQGEFWEPIVTMLAFSVAFALPFTVLAFAPGLLKKLPKSGGWLNSVKVCLGFIEIALGLKFLSVADQTYHWGILPRELYLAIWIVVFTLMGFYLLGKIRFKNDSPLQYVSVTRLVLAIASFTFVVWMIPGMFGAPLKALSGYLPPITDQEFVLSPTAAAPHEQPSRSSTHKYSDFLKAPYGLDAYFDYDEALEAARKEGKPLLLDFTGHGCVNCREMESRVWSDPEVLQLLREDYILCSLYTDDKKTLPEEDWVRTSDGKTLKTLGKINSHFALERFGVNSQPCYIILDARTQTVKTSPRGYSLNTEAYREFLRAGLK